MDWSVAVGFELVGRLSVEDCQKLADSLVTGNATLPVQRIGEQSGSVGGDEEGQCGLLHAEQGHAKPGWDVKQGGMGRSAL
ncbi:hypothetical protein [Ferruginivarius sediminum]|uniref:Uncharacterized protein n=1 Tax=Ferruginivarius sediminum TaxID=2661937 RepID=A0A369TEN1_9PROT|nr:hypothetical protein [Ferruginivarius sediminum]RDD63799.1 hypothetical protein DRB17_01105 [Ferruginivarius sediminum]